MDFERSLTRDVADYLMAEGIEKEAILDYMKRNYRTKLRADGRIEFLENGSTHGTIIDPPFETLRSAVAGYLQQDDASSQLVQMAYLDDNYEREETERGGIRYSDGDFSIEISPPSLREIARSLQRTQNSLDREMLQAEMKDRFRTTGDLTGTVFYDGESAVLEKDKGGGRTEYIIGDRPGEFFPLRELVETYKQFRDGPSTESGKEFWRSIEEIFETGETDQFKVFHDPENQEVVLFDMHNVDVEVHGEQVLSVLGSDKSLGKWSFEDLKRELEGFTPDDEA